MAGARRPTPTETVELSVHNEGPDPVEVEVVVHGDGVAVRSLRLDVAETGSLSAPAGAAVEVHTPDGTATSLAASGAFFVVRNRRVLVAPE
jgi:intracellular sulfur oxidation DsrE/DsrF family protein